MSLPENFKLKIPEKKDFELLPDDTYQVAITKLELKEGQPVYESKTGEVEDRVEFEFTIVEDGPYKGRKLWKNVSTTMSAGSTGYSPSGLYKLFCAVNRFSLSDEEAKSVEAKDINEMLGKELRLVVKQEKSRKGNTKNKIKDVLPLKNALPASLPQEYAGDINVEDIPF